MFAGAAIVMALIGLSLLLTALDQLRERRRLLAVLVAFGTRRSTLSWSLLWQSAVPVGLGLAVAVLTGLGLGAVLLRLVGTGFHVAWLDVLGDGRRRRRGRRARHRGEPPGAVPHRQTRGTADGVAPRE